MCKQEEGKNYDAFEGSAMKVNMEKNQIRWKFYRRGNEMGSKGITFGLDLTLHKLLCSRGFNIAREIRFAEIL